MSAAVAVVLALLELATGHDLRRDLVGRAVHAWIGLAVPAAILSSSRALEVVIALLGIALLVAVVTRAQPPTVRGGKRSELLRQARELQARYDAEEGSDGA